MILELVKRDPAWKIGLFMAPVTVLLLLVDPGDPEPQWTSLLPLLIVSGFMCPHRRATLFEAALPIEGRHLFLARLLSRLAMVWLPVLAAILVILPGRDTGWPQVLGMLECGTLYTLAILLPLSVRVRECAAPGGLLAAAWAGLAAAGALAWHFLPPGLFLAVFVFAGAVILLRAWFAIPASFQVAPIEAVDSVASPRSTQDARPFAWWPIVRSAVPLFSVPAAIFLGWSAELLAPFVAVFAITATMDVRRRTRWLYALPLSFRALGLIILAPSLAILLAGMAIGTWLDNPLQRDYSLVGGPRSQSRTDVNLDVNFEFWHRAPAGNAPVISAPWGETVHATTVRVMGMTFYNPYSVGPRNSERFVMWQFERATKTVYGRVITLRQYGAARDAGLVPVTAWPRMRILTLSAAMVGMLLLVYMGEWTRWYRLPGLAESVRESLPFVPLFVILLIVFFVEWHYSSRIGTALFHAALLQLSSLLPDNLLVVTTAAMVPVIGVYWLLEKQFSKSEMLGPIQQSSAWGRRMQAE